MLCIPGWILRRRTATSATVLLCPWPDLSIRLAAGSAATGMQSVNIILKIRRGGHPHHQVPAMGVAKHHNQYVFFAVPGLQGRPGLCHFSPCCACIVKRDPNAHYGTSQWWLCQSRESWHSGGRGEENGCYFKRSRLSLLPVSSYDCGLQLHTFMLPLEVVDLCGSLSTLL